MGNKDVQKEAAELNAEEAAYDRGYDDGWMARDKLAVSRDLRPSPWLKAQVLEVLREVGLLGNIASCP